jgi:hypothetical protein
MRNDIDMECIEVDRTDKAILVHHDDDKPNAWLPLSAVEVEPVRNIRPGSKAVVVTLPIQLAIDMGMI